MNPLWDEATESALREAAHSLDKQNSPKTVKFCKRCVISNQRPRIVFDENGVCSACRYAEHKRNGIDWGARQKKLVSLLDKHRKPSGYDVVVPCSGGKDSAVVAHKLKHEYGMNPLCVKWAPFLYTDIGRRNFEAFVQSGFDCMVAWPNGIIHRKLARLSFEFLGDAFQPFVFGQLAYPMRIAHQFNIPLVFYGENGEAEYGGDPSANDKPCWDQSDWDRIYMKSAGISRLLDIGKSLNVFSGREIREVSDFYSLPIDDCPDHVSPEFHWFGYYKKWHPQGNFYYASENTGFEPNTERSEGTYSKYASLDDKTDGFHYYMAYIKFGLGRCTSDAAHEVRDGDITREEAVALVGKYDGEFPRKYFREFLEYLGLDEIRFWQIVDRYRPARLWERKDKSWWLRHSIVDTIPRIKYASE